MEEWGFDTVCQVFVLLASGASFDIFRDPCPGAGPEVFFVDTSDCFIASGMAIDGAFMPYVHQFVFQSLIWGYHESASLGIPPEWFTWVVHLFDWVDASPFLH